MFPVIITALIPLRTHIMPRLFLQHEVEIMDDLTANNVAVLASLGDEPQLPEGRKVEDRALVEGTRSRGGSLRGRELVVYTSSQPVP